MTTSVTYCEKPFFVFFLAGDRLEKVAIVPGYLSAQFRQIRSWPGFRELTEPIDSVTIPGPSQVSDNDETIEFEDRVPVGTLMEQAKRSGRCF